MKIIPNLIIGAGPAGLATAGRFRSTGLPFHMLEQADKIAITWRMHYDRLHLHTVKQYSALPGLDFPENYPIYVSRTQLLDYLEDYARHFDIRPQLGAKVTSIIPAENKSWKVTLESGEHLKAQHVIVATGINRVPHQPNWEGQDFFQGEIIHSRWYKNPKPFSGKKVLVVGMGNTGAEVALDLCENGVETWVSVRGKVNIIPRDVFGTPAQITAKRLEKLPLGLGDWVGTQIRSILVGDLSKYGLQTNTIPPLRQLQETGKTPLIDLGTIKAVKEGKIKILPDILRFEENCIHLNNGEKMEFDAVILATGYKADVPDFIQGIVPFLDKFQLPRHPIGTGEFDGLFFVGFDNYKVGGTLGTIYTDSATVAQEIARRTNS